MKRLIAILAVFTLMIGAAVFELVYTQKFYKEELRLLAAVEEVFDSDPEHIDRESSVKAFETAFTKWEKHRRYILMLANHNTAKYVDEKLVSLKEQIRLNQQYDAYVSLKTAVNYIEELKDDILPSLSNLL